jgi:predicted RNA-binding protein
MQLITTEAILQLTTADAIAQNRIRLEQYIAHLMDTNFAELVNLLYRLDVDEHRIKHYAQDKFLTPEAITIFIIERLEQRMVARDLFGKRYTKDADDDLVEPW